MAAALIAAPLTAFAADSTAPAADAPAPPRVEARSANLLAVGLVRGARLNIHLSRLIDNAPVRDAVVTVVLRGNVRPAIAETDGSYTLETEDLTLPGSSALEIQVVENQARENLQGTLQIAAATSKPAGKNNARQLWWWVLNFAVCIGFLMLLSRRRKPRT